MFRIYILFFLCVCLFNLGGCDQAVTEDKKLVGNIFLINPHNQDVNGYRMVIYEGEINSNILEDNVNNVVGNDSILLVICKAPGAVFKYYRIDHYMGKKLLKTSLLSKNEYSQLKMQIQIKYQFSDNSD